MLNQIVSIIEKADPDQDVSGGEESCGDDVSSSLATPLTHSKTVEHSRNAPSSCGTPPPPADAGDVCIDLSTFSDPGHALRSKSECSVASRGRNTPARDNDESRSVKSLIYRSLSIPYIAEKTGPEKTPEAKTVLSSQDTLLSDAYDNDPASLADMSVTALCSLVRIKTAQEQAAVEKYREKLVNLHDFLAQYSSFQKRTSNMLGDCQNALAAARVTSKDISSFKETLREEISSAERTAHEVEAWYRLVRRETETEATGERALQVVTSHLQGTIQRLEEEVAELKAREEAAVERSSVALVEASSVPVVRSDVVEGNEEIEKLKRRLQKATADSGTKQMTLGVLYEEKEDLRVRLDAALKQLSTVDVVPQQQLDDSKLFQTLSHRGQWGARVATAVTRVDGVTMRFGRMLYANAIVRVSIALYFILLHLWVFWVVTQYVHVLPHTAESIHEHQKLFDN